MGFFMRNNWTKYLLPLCLLLVVSNKSFACNPVKKGMEALHIFNYFEAKNQFEKSFKKNRSIASFGLSTIYSRNDNPFYNLDSAYRFILIAQETYGDIEIKKRAKFAENYGFKIDSIIALRQRVGDQRLAKIQKGSSQEVYDNYLLLHPWANKFDSITGIRDSLAFNATKQQNTSLAYEKYVSKYPNSKFTSESIKLFNLSQFAEQTKTGSVAEYNLFIENFPSNTYVEEAQDKVYSLYTNKFSAIEYKQFIDDNPTNKNVEDAWMKLYRLSTSDYTEKSINQFIADYPEFPLKNEIQKDIELINLRLVPFKSGTYQGFMNYDGEVIIPAIYDQVSMFKEGLSAVSKNGKFGFITKDNQVVIDFIYDDATDFEEGRSVVENNELFGMINRTGEEVIAIAFEDLGTIADGLIYGLKDSLYAFYDIYGFQRIPERFDEAYNFINGEALVIVNDNEALIDIYGSYVVPPGSASLKRFNDSLFIAEEDDLYGIIKSNFEVVLPYEYDEIGVLSDNRALVIKDGLVGYINENATIVIEPAFEEFPNILAFGSFKTGYAKVRKKDRYGIIDPKGKPVVPIIFDEIGQYGDLIPVSKGSGYGYTNLSTRLIVPYDYEFTYDFKNGRGVVENLLQQGLIDKKGNIILPLEYSAIKSITDSLYVVNKGSNYGLVDYSGESITSLEFQRIFKLNDKIIVLQKSDEVKYYLIREQRIIARKNIE